MTAKTLEQEEVLYEFDAQSYSLFGKPLGTDRVLIVRTEDGRSRFTTRELDGSLAIGQLQLGAAAAEEILRLKAAATARDKEVVGLRAKLTEAKAAIRWMHGYDEPGTEDFPICPEGKRYAWRGVSRQQFAIVREACSEPIPLPEGE